MGKHTKTKKTAAAIFAVWLMFSIIGNIGNFQIFGPVAAADESPVSITGINMPGTVVAGRAFRAEVTVKNNTSAKLEGIKVSTTNTSNGAISVTTRETVAISLEAGAQETITFDFNLSAGNVPANTVYEITFGVESGGQEKTETRRLAVELPAPEQPPKPPYFEKLTEAHTQNVEAGGNVKISFRFVNSGDTAADNVTAKISYPDGAEPVSQTEIFAGRMLPGSSFDCAFEFKITDKARIGLNTFTIVINADNAQYPLNYPIGVTIRKGEEDETAKIPNISITSINIPESAKRGESFVITAELENTGADSGSIELTLSSPPGMENHSSGIVQIGSIKQNSSTEAEFIMRVTDSAADGYNSFVLTLEYEIDGEVGPEKIKRSQYAGLLVPKEEEKEKASKNFSIEAKLPAQTKTGEDFVVLVTVKNNGADEKDLKININAPAGMANMTLANFTIPELKSGQSATYEATFRVGEEAAGKYSLFYASLLAKDSEVLAECYAGTLVAKIELPKLVIESIKLPQNSNIGDKFEVIVTLANTASASAENVMVNLAGIPNGIQNQSASLVKLDSIEGGKKATATFVFMVTQQVAYGYNPFELEVSYASASNAGGERISQYFGLSVNSSDLRIESVAIPGSVGVNTDFSVSVSVKNTGADAADVMLALSPQGGLVNKSSSITKIDLIKSGETITRTFVFMAPESAPDGYVAINIALSHGDEQITQYSGTIVRNPPKTEEEKPPEDIFGDIPVVIISRFAYENVVEPTAEKEADMFANTSIVSVADAPVAIAPAPAPAPGNSSPDYGFGYNVPDSYQGGGSYASAIKDSNAVYGGKTFNFTLELLNTHKSLAVKDLKVTISQDHGIFNPKSGSNTFFVEWLEPGGTAEIEIELLVKSDADPDSYGLTISLSYKSEKGEATSSSEIINIPVQQEMRFSIGDLPPIYDIEMGDEAYVNVQFGNLGKSWIYNVVVRATGDGFTNMEGTYYAGNIEKGKFLSKEFVLTPYNPGYLSGSFVFSYEDADGNSYTEECPFGFMVMGDYDNMEDMPWGGEDEIKFGPDGMPIEGEEEQEEGSGGFWLFTDMNLLKWAIIAGGALLVIVVVIVIIVRVRRKKAEEDDDEL